MRRALALLHFVGQLYADSFRGLPRIIWLLCAAFLVNRAGTMVMPFLSLYATVELGLSKVQAGWILVAFGLGSITGSYLGGKLSVVLGPVRVLKLSLLSAGVGFVTLTQLGSLAAFLPGVFLTSICSEAFRPAALSSVADFAPPELRTRSLALLRLAVNLGMGLGPALGGWFAEIDYHLLFVGDGVSCFLAGLFLVVVLPASASRREEGAANGISSPRRPAWKDGPFLGLLGIVFLFALAIFQIVGAYPIYLHEVHCFSTRAVGLFLGSNALMVVAMEMPLVRLLERRDSIRIFGFGCFLLSLGFAVMPLGSGHAFIAFTVVVWTFGEMLAMPFSNTLVAARAGGGASGEYMGLYATTFSTALLIGPALGLRVYEHLGPSALWFSVGGLGLLCWLASVWLAPHLRPPRPEAEAGLSPPGGR